MKTASVNLESLAAMKKQWSEILEERSKMVIRLKSDLEALRGSGGKADIDPVLAFYESVLEAGKAAGRVALLQDLLAKIGTGSTDAAPIANKSEDFGI